MSRSKTLNVDKDLKGMTVLVRDTGEMLGKVSDIIVHPIEGRVLGIIVKTSNGAEHRIPTGDFLLGEDAIMVPSDVLFDDENLSGSFTGGVLVLRDLIGTNVVTEDGRVLGKINEAHILIESPRVIYRVTESALQRFFGGGFYIAGNLAQAFSHDAVRMIVPTETEDSYAASSIDEFFEDGRDRARAARR